MPNRWESEAFCQENEELEKQMDPHSIRTKCFSRGLITAQQKNTLSYLHGVEHNSRLLSILGSLDDDKYDVFCEVLLDNSIRLHIPSVARLRTASSAAAVSAPTVSAPSATGPVQGGRGLVEKDGRVIEAEKKTLQSLLVDFTDTVTPEALCDHLRASRIITDVLRKTLANEDILPKDRAHKLIEAVIRGGDTAFDCLIAALEKSNLLQHEQLAAKLKAKLEEILAET